MSNKINYLMKAAVIDKGFPFELDVPMSIEVDTLEELIVETINKLKKDSPSIIIIDVKMIENYTNQCLTIDSNEEKIEKLIEKMKNLPGDQDTDHLIADGILVDALELLGYKELADAYRKVEKWYA